MKNTILFSVILFALTMHLKAQEHNLLALYTPAIRSKAGVVKNTIKNSVYLSNIHKSDQSKFISDLQKKIAHYNLEPHKIYSKKEKSFYDLVIGEKNAKLYIRYDQKGIVLYSVEQYKNVKVPYEITQKIARENPGWFFGKNKYTITYGKEDKVKRGYRIQLKKGGQKKVLKIKTVHAL
ncbi:hypothetical protein [Maribacter sp. 2304DJ31-5]|uniref:hypothetical protein n=1 Tax=Maribacter sp. 2304DJ31-5 TaxID=3386273 RepID=UPI0039BD6E1E